MRISNMSPTMIPAEIPTAALASQHDATNGESLNQKLLRFIVENVGRTPPEREKTFRQEILIPCFNHGRFLPGLLAAMEGLDCPITIINDKSTDDTREIIAELATRHDFKLLDNDVNLRQHGSLNRAIAQSENNLFTVVNADDYLIPGWIEYVRRVFSGSGLFLLGGGSLAFRNGCFPTEPIVGKIMKSISYRHVEGCTVYGPVHARRFSHSNSINMTMSGCTFLRSAWEFVGGFRSIETRVSVHDDRDFQMRVCAFFPIGVTEEISAFWRMDSSTGMGNK